MPRVDRSANTDLRQRRAIARLSRPKIIGPGDIDDDAIGPDQLGILSVKGDMIVYSTAPQRLPAGGDGQVLAADSSDQKGVAWTSATELLGMISKGDLLTRTASAAVALSIGASGTVLRANGSQAAGMEWVSVQALLPLAAQGDLLTHSGTDYAVLPAGTDGYVLACDSEEEAGLAWVNVVPLIQGVVDAAIPFLEIGDLLVFDGDDPVALEVGDDGQVLTADSAAPEGVAWADLPASGISEAEAIWLNWTWG